MLLQYASQVITLVFLALSCDARMKHPDASRKTLLKLGEQDYDDFFHFRSVGHDLSSAMELNELMIACRDLILRRPNGV